MELPELIWTWQLKLDFLGFDILYDVGLYRWVWYFINCIGFMIQFFPDFKDDVIADFLTIDYYPKRTVAGTVFILKWKSKDTFCERYVISNNLN